jgi:hypothetical protein
MKYRVIQWATGFLGQMGIRAIVDHPMLELAGVRVFSADKRGKDAGELSGIGPTGILASDSESDLLALDADCIVWMGLFRPDVRDAIPELCRLLESGKNVISVAHWPFIHPGSVPPAVREPVEAACANGGTTFLNTGVDTGFISEVLVPTLTGSCRKINSILVQEVLNYGVYEQAGLPAGLMGFGRPAAVAEQFLNAGNFFEPSIRTIADAVDAPLDKVELDWELHMAEREYQTSFGTIPPGSVAAMRFWYTGFINGEPRIKIQHVTRTAAEQAPSWPQGDGYTVDIDGEPRWNVYLKLGGDDSQRGLVDAYVATASIAVHAVPSVCEAAPGIVTRMDLPMVVGPGVMQRSSDG